MTKQDAYEKATALNLGNPNGTRMDIVFSAMHIYVVSILKDIYDAGDMSEAMLWKRIIDMTIGSSECSPEQFEWGKKIIDKHQKENPTMQHLRGPVNDGHQPNVSGNEIPENVLKLQFSKKFDIDWSKVDSVEKIVAVLKGCGLTVLWHQEECPEQFIEINNMGLLVEAKQ